MRIFVSCCVVVLVGLIIFTITASQLFIFWAKLGGFFSFPFYQFWLYLLFNPDEPFDPAIVASCLRWAAFPALAVTFPFVFMTAAIMMRRGYYSSMGPQNQFWRPQMDRREWRRAPPPPIIGSSPNHGIARFASEDEQRQRFPEP